MSIFNKKLEENQELQSANLSNVIGKGTVLTGDIEAYGNIRIEGKIIGNIYSKSKVVLGNGSYVEGNITAQNAEIEGEVKGKLEITDMLSLKSTALINGDIHTAKIIIDAGGKFNGSMHMDGGKKIQALGKSNSRSGKKLEAAV
ncbi:MAG: bactofilin family protein [Flammeovirgaceae bacterium]